MKASIYKIAQVFAEAGFLEAALFEQMVRESGKSLTEILFSDISGRSLKDLITYEIPLPFGRTRRDRVQATLRRDLTITPSELQQIFHLFPERLPQVAKTLEAHRLLWPETTQRVCEGVEKHGADFVDTLVKELLLTVETVASFLEQPNPISQSTRRRFTGDLMVHNSLIDADQSQQIQLRLAENGEVNPAQVLADVTGIDQSTLVKAIRGGLYLPRVNLASVDLRPEHVAQLPADFLRRHLLLPFRAEGDTVHLAMSDPLNTVLIDALVLLSGRHIAPHFASQQDLISKLNMLLPDVQPGAAARSTELVSGAMTATAEETPFDGESDLGGALPAEEVESETLVDNISTVELVSAIIESAFATRATDIHIEPMQEQIRVRYRIDGHLKSIMQIPLEMLLPVVSRIKVLSDLNVTERRRPQDGHFSLDLEDTSIDLRISVVPTHMGEKVVIRLLDEANLVRGVADLGMPEEENRRLSRLIERPHGQILVAGPTGSGKTTTLYASLSVLNSEEINIITIEDPVEYRLDGINQIQVDPKIDLTFAAGLRATLRQDPDVIMVGEIRDQETARIAVRSALTGHLVLSTLHSNRSAGVISALLQMGIPAFSVANSLVGIVSQRLARRLCTECREAFMPKKALKTDLGLPPNSRKTLHRAKGCDRCLDIGYSGQTGVFEVWEITPAMREVILAEGSETKLAEVAVSEGMRSLLENAKDLLFQGVTSPDEILRSVGLE